MCLISTSLFRFKLNILSKKERKAATLLAYICLRRFNNEILRQMEFDRMLATEFQANVPTNRSYRREVLFTTSDHHVRCHPPTSTDNNLPNFSLSGNGSEQCWCFDVCNNVINSSNTTDDWYESFLHPPSLRALTCVAEHFTDPTAFLTAIGRSSEKKVKADSWEDLWKLDGIALKKQGMSVQDRRYVLVTIFLAIFFADNLSTQVRSLGHGEVQARRKSFDVRTRSKG